MHYAVCGISGSDKTALLNNLRHLPQMTRLTTWATGEEEAPWLLPSRAARGG